MPVSPTPYPITPLRMNQPKAGPEKPPPWANAAMPSNVTAMVCRQKFAADGPRKPTDRLALTDDAANRTMASNEGIMAGAERRSAPRTKTWFASEPGGRAFRA